MRIEYGKPWHLKSKLDLFNKNLLMNRSFTLTISFKVEKDFKKDEKIGFFGIPGKSFGISYDYEVNKFVFEFWTQKSEVDEPEFNLLKDFDINEDDLANGVTITMVYDSDKLKFILYNDFNLIGNIKLKHPLVKDYETQPIYFGCHNQNAYEERHRCFTEMELTHFSVYEGALNIINVESYVNKVETLLGSEDYKKLLCLFDFEEVKDDFLVFDNVKNLYFLKSGSEVNMIDFNITKEKLNTVGCGFCLAKWTQVTMHLHNGTTHSCHHPEPHKVGLEEINRNPTALHNSKLKKQARKKMLENKRPSECAYCWNVEDNSTSFSDRIFKSSEPWSEPYFDEIAKSDWRDDYNPKYAEVSFSNTCNFKCAYCGPEYSSKWMDEINEHGAYMLSYEYNGTRRLEERNTKPYKHSEQNPYVDAFWEWFPELYTSLDTFRITGGEPLLSKDTWKVLDYIIESETPNTELKLSINSNLGVTDDLIDKLILKLDRIIKEGRVKEVVIFTSCDGYGKQVEFVRYGLDFEKLFSNIDKILTVLDKVTVVVMSTFNIFSVFTYEELIRKIHTMKLKHFNTKRYWNSAIILDTSYLRHPPFMSFRLLKGYLNVEYFKRWEKFMKFNSTYRSLNFYEQQTIDDVGFSTKEIEKITRIKDMFISDEGIDDDQFRVSRLDFVNFIAEYEKRRGLKCEKYFPELKDFIKQIKNENKL